MNWDRIEGNRKQSSRNAMRQCDVLLGRMQELYGISKDGAEKELANWQQRMQKVRVISGRKPL